MNQMSQQKFTDLNSMGIQMPTNTKDVCCVCGYDIPDTDYRGGSLHDGFTYMQDGSKRFVHRQRHAACKVAPNQNLLW